MTSKEFIFFTEKDVAGFVFAGALYAEGKTPEEALVGLIRDRLISYDDKVVAFEKKDTYSIEGIPRLVKASDKSPKKRTKNAN